MSLNFPCCSIQYGTKMVQLITVVYTVSKTRLTHIHTRIQSHTVTLYARRGLIGQPPSSVSAHGRFPNSCDPSRYAEAKPALSLPLTHIKLDHDS